MLGLITDIDRFSTHDGPGIRTTVIIQGCPMHFAWCHSPETQPASPVPIYRSMKCIGCRNCMYVCPHGAITPKKYEEDGEKREGIRIDTTFCKKCFACVEVCPSGALTKSSREMSLREVKDIITQDIPFYRHSGGGVTLSGGEVLMQAEFALEILSFCRLQGVHTAVETTGCGSWDSLYEICRKTDLIYYDIKLLDSELHRKFTGMSNDVILRNLRRLSENREAVGEIVVRIPCIPGINDHKEQIEQTARFVSELKLSFLELLPYNEAAGAKYMWLFQDYSLQKLHTRKKEYYEELQKYVSQFGLLPYGVGHGRRKEK